ncbi:PTS sugar transporter subunit IIA [Niallia nealsonii]|uniref:PTS fructose transporter subunit IIA n=1 Tax=Niallia nealsonii TaxID=115979 RepID=A0A2N0YXS7_9BACI|nr:PTS sugar transporter subunit IIA [Niallia nealsonii]PKG22061.1 PTS fructose transporter subunit IIA [Niallia nealsonii]
MTVVSFIKENLIKVNLEVENQDELFQVMYQEAYDQGYVKDTFLAKIKERESIFPTGLCMADYSVAIPHTDPEHVIEQFIAVATLKKPVAFSLMEDNTKTTDVDVVLMLGLNQPHSQLEILQELMQVIQIKDNLINIIQAKNEKEILTIFENINIAIIGGD